MPFDRSACESRRAHHALVGLFVACYAIGNAAPLDAQFAVSPVIVQMPFDVDGGSAMIRIDNEGENDMQFRVYAMDFDQDREGNHLFAAPRTAAESCAHRLRFAPDALSVPAGGRASIQVLLDPDLDAPTCWSMLFVEAPSATESAVRVNQRIGVKLYGLGVASGGEAGLFEAAASPADGSVEVTFSFRNAGEWPIRPSGSVEVRDLAGAVIAATPVNPFSVLPRHEREIRVRLPLDGVPAGRYLAVPVLDYGADFLAGAQVDFRLTD